MSVRPTAAQVLRRLGVARPADIDLEATAWSLGVVGVKERKLDGCEARIVGLGDRAIVSLDPRPIPRRRRFSLAHELGHWIHHRGKTTFCRKDDIGDAREFADVERTANAFASDLVRREPTETSAPDPTISGARPSLRCRTDTPIRSRGG